MVEGAHHVLNGVAGDERDTRPDWFDAGYVVKQSARLRIALGADSVWVGLEKAPDLDIHILPELQLWRKLDVFALFIPTQAACCWCWGMIRNR